MTAPVDKMRPVTPQGLVSLLQEKKGGFTYGYFHGPAQTQGLADVSGNEDDDMKGVVKNITYGDLWSKKNAKHEHGMQRRLLNTHMQRIRTMPTNTQTSHVICSLLPPAFPPPFSHLPTFLHSASTILFSASLILSYSVLCADVVLF